MNTLLLKPADLLFFKDGRPLEGSLSGHSMIWPTPDIVNHALHAALHTSELIEQAQVHAKDIKLGNLCSVGPFPVNGNIWHFARPLDLEQDSLQPSCLPCSYSNTPAGSSSLPGCLKYPIASTIAPSKNNPAKVWLSKQSFENYINSKHDVAMQGVNPDCIANQECFTGIGIDTQSGVAGVGEASGKIYSAHYLRLKPEWQLGLLASAEASSRQQDLIVELCKKQDSIVLGGQQRICNMQLQADTQQLPLPCGITEAPQADADGKVRIKWILLTPAIYPHMPANPQKNIAEHHGGWLPNWICQHSGKVLLKPAVTRQAGQSRLQWRKACEQQTTLAAKLVAVRSEKPQIITGYATSRDKVGAKSTHLAVPAGSIYYFECDNRKDAGELLQALNWHACQSGAQQILNRRSTLLGEKGFGLGVCAGWKLL